MVRAADGSLVSVEAHGHAGAGKPGFDIVCSAVTALIRTTLEVVAEEGLIRSADSAGRGSLAFSVSAPEGESFPLLGYAARFLEKGIRSLSREYPESVRLNVLDSGE